MCEKINWTAFGAVNLQSGENFGPMKILEKRNKPKICITYLAPAFAFSDLVPILQVDAEFILARKRPLKATAVGRCVFLGRLQHHFGLVYCSEIDDFLSLKGMVNAQYFYFNL